MRIPIYNPDISKYKGINSFKAIWAAVDLDEHTRPAKVKLLSVHDNVINLQVDGWKHLLFVVRPVLEAGPATIALQDSDFIFFKKRIVKSKVGEYKRGCLSVTEMTAGSNLNIILELKWQEGVRKSFVPLFLRDCDRALIRKALREYCDMLRGIKLPGSSAVLLGLPGGETYFRNLIAENFPPLVEALLSCSQDSFLNYSNELVGMGRGLTPTGDDLLHGALITVYSFTGNISFIESTRSAFEPVTLKTNLFGRHMLEMGLTGLTPDIFRYFLKTVAQGEPDINLIKRIGTIGSSSGYDTVIAMIFSLNKLFV